MKTFSKFVDFPKSRPPQLLHSWNSILAEILSLLVDECLIPLVHGCKELDVCLGRNHRYENFRSGHSETVVNSLSQTVA